MFFSQPAHRHHPEHLIISESHETVPRVARFADDWPMSATEFQNLRLRDALVAELLEA